MPYTTLAELKDYLGIALTDTASDPALERAINVATAQIDHTCGRTFGFENEATKYFVSKQDYVDVPDLLSITSIAVDTAGNRTYATALTASDYLLWPLDGPPYTQVRSWSTSSHGFLGRHVKIIGDFGYPDASGIVPQDVVQACLLLATRIHKRADAPFGVLQAVDLGTFERLRADDPDVLTLLRPHMATRDWVAV